MGILSGPPTTIQVVLAKPFFYIGEPITGTAIIDVQSDTKVRKIRIVFHGNEYCLWTEQQGSGDDSRTVTYTSSVDIAKFESIVWGGDGENILKQGHYEFPFVYPALTPNVPAPFEHSVGHVRYAIDVTIDIPWGKDGTCKCSVPIVPTYQLMALQTQNFIRSAQTRKTPGCCCFSSGAVESTLALTQESTLVNFPGIRCVVQVDINNQSARKLPRARVELVERYLFRAQGHENQSFKVVGTLQVPFAPILPRSDGKGTIDCSSLFNPTLITSIGQVCQRHHLLRLHVAIPCALDPVTALPVFCIPEGPPPAGAAPPPGVVAPPPGAVVGGAPPPAGYGSVVGVPPQPGFGGAPAPAPAPAGVPRDPDFDGLLSKLDSEVSKLRFLEDWFMKHPSTNPSPEQLAQVVSKIFSLEQANAASILASCVPNITCAHVVAILGVMGFSGKIDALKSLAPKIKDKQNKGIIIETASMLERDDYIKILN